MMDIILWLGIVAVIAWCAIEILLIESSERLTAAISVAVAVAGFCIAIMHFA